MPRVYPPILQLAASQLVKPCSLTHASVRPLTPKAKGIPVGAYVPRA